MAPRISNDLRRLVIRMHQQGRNQQDIADTVGILQCTVSRIIRRHQETGSVSPGRSSGRTRITDHRDDRILLRMVRQNRRESARSLSMRWGNQLGRPISRRTTNRRVTAAGYFSRRLVRCPLLIQRHRAARLEWARQHRNLTVQHWRHVLFSDESRVCLDPADGRLRVRRMRRQPLDDEDMMPVRQGGGGSVHIWAAIHYNGKCELQILNENVNGESYRRLMEDVALPYARGVFGENFVWQHDNAPAHKSRVVRQLLEQEDVNVLPWPACSPDCNPIENCWDQLKRAVHSRNPRPTNLAELAAFLQEEWRNIDVNYVNNLIDSMERRVTSVIQSRGRSIRY